jgi:hypothetical protein
MKLWILQKQGQSVESASYESTRFLEEARVLGIDVQLVASEEIDLIVSRDGPRSIRRSGEQVDLPDGLLPRAGSGSDTFTLAVLRQFEHLAVPVINSSQSIEAVKDKLVCLQKLARANLPIPRTMLVRFPVDCDLVERQIGFPCVVKVLVGSHGEGIYLSRDRSSFRDGLQPEWPSKPDSAKLHRRSSRSGFKSLGHWRPGRWRDVAPKHRWQLQGQHHPWRSWRVLADGAGNRGVGARVRSHSRFGGGGSRFAI